MPATGGGWGVRKIGGGRGGGERRRDRGGAAQPARVKGKGKG